MSAPLSLLLVEDNPGDVRLLREFLREAALDWQLDHAGTLAAGLAKLSARPYDLVLLDLGLPDAQGLSTLSQLRTACPDVPVVVLTGHQDEQLGVRTIGEGAQDYLLKGEVQAREFCRVVRYTVERARTAREKNEVQDALEALRDLLVHCGTREPGADFFRSLASFLGRYFRMDYVCIDQLEQGNLTARTLAVYCDGTFQDNVCYTLKDTPCGDVVTKSACSFPSGVCGLFPNDEVLKDLGAESYFGITLFGHEGEPIGLIALIGRRVEERPEVVKSALELVAPRAAAELERTQAEARLRASEERYRSLVETSFDWVWEVDACGRYTFVSEKLRGMLGYEPASVLGLTPFDLMPPEEAERVRGAFGALSAERRAFVGFENTNLHRDGRLVVLETSGTPVFGEDGAYLGYRGTDRDVTARKRLDAEKQQLEARLRQAQKMEAIGTLAGGIAHDFNNILTPIMAHGELALMQLPEGDPVRDDISDLLAAAERAAALVRQILAVSRKEDAGAPVAVNVGELVTEAVKFLRASIPSTIEIALAVDPACGPVLAEPERLHQVLLNLCTNASYAMADTGGVLTLSLTGEESGGRRWVRLAVSDTGPGLTPEVRARIFEPYFTTKPVGKGSGLGLAVVHGIVTSLGGEIHASDAPGGGARFDVRLPETQRPVTWLASAERPVRGDGEHVLAVDDEPEVRAVLERLLAALGYRVTVCASGTEALGVFLLDPGTFDAVLTDYTMPGLTGTALAARLRVRRPELPIVVATGFAQGLDERTLAAAGLTGPVMKPYSLHALGKAMAQALGGGGAPPGAGEATA